MIRSARLSDLDALVALETASFDSDRISRRSFRHLLTRAKAITLVDEEAGLLRGYALVLFHAGTSLARLYSIAVASGARGKGVGADLLTACEAAALERDCVSMRLEIRTDNAAAEHLYRSHGYRPLGQVKDYYEDHTDALRMEKSLAPHLAPDMVRVPYYEQTLEFTCGPAALIMAMQALDPALIPDRKLETRLWRESTTIFMTSGHGGCGPYGMALSAHHRDFVVEIYVKDQAALFIDSVRSEEKKEVIRLVQEDFVEEIENLGIPVHYQPITVEILRAHFESGGIPVVLISSYRLYAEKFPHWVVITGFDERFVYVHDPYVDADMGKVRLDCINMPIPKNEFARMIQYGKSAQQAALILRLPN